MAERPRKTSLSITEHFSLALMVQTLCRYCLKSAFFKGEWVTLSTNFRQKGTAPANLCWYQKTKSDYHFTWYQNIGSMFFRFVTKHTCDRWTDK